MSFQLRGYQEDACDAVEREWLFGEAKAVMVEMATGLGKTECFVEMGRRHADTRTLVICPMNNLIGQAAGKFLKRTGIAPDIEQAERWANESEWARLNEVGRLCQGTGNRATGERPMTSDRTKCLNTLAEVRDTIARLATGGADLTDDEMAIVAQACAVYVLAELNATIGNPRTSK